MDDWDCNTAGEQLSAQNVAVVSLAGEKAAICSTDTKRGISQ
jgi:hypothetical protein